MSEREFRQDDTSDAACPVCFRELTNLQVSGFGYCEVHGYVPAEWRPPIEEGEEERDG